MVASSTSKHSCGASAITFCITRTIFFNSSIRPLLFCRRPAVSTNTTSSPSAMAFCSPSKQSPALSQPSAPAKTRTPARSPQARNCSTAAARKVSPAIKDTFKPCFFNFVASLPMVVVLPAPFTPANRITKGFRPRSTTNFFSVGRRIFPISSASLARIS